MKSPYTSIYPKAIAKRVPAMLIADTKPRIRLIVKNASDMAISPTHTIDPPAMSLPPGARIKCLNPSCLVTDRPCPENA